MNNIQINPFQAHPEDSDFLCPEIHHKNKNVPASEGERLFIYPNYSEFRPIPIKDDSMNALNPDFKGFTSYYEKTRPRSRKLDKIRFSVNTQDEERVFVRKPSIKKEITKRGIITKMSQKSSIRCRKTLARMYELSLWVDFTFADDVFLGLDDQGIKDKSNLILKKYQRYLKTLGLMLFWKREWKPRRSGSLKGQKIPHFHVFIIGLTEKQKNNPEFIAIQLLIKWVQDTGTNDPRALKVALHRGDDGSPASYRMIHSSKVAIKYVSKYFSKTETVPGYESESIGRTWGYSTGLKGSKYMAGPVQITLSSSESVQIRRFIRKALRLQKSKGLHIGLYEQFVKGYSTFAFMPENLIMRLINRFVPDPFKIVYSDEVPF